LQKEKFHGDRSEDNLVEFVLDHLNVEVKEITPSTWSKFNGEPRMLFFSDFSGDGPSEETRLKVAAMLVSPLVTLDAVFITVQKSRMD
jgi:hypothetical protein